MDRGTLRRQERAVVVLTAGSGREDQQKTLPHTAKNSAVAVTLLDAPVASSVTTTDMVRVVCPRARTITEQLKNDDVQPPNGAIVKPLVPQSKLYPLPDRPITSKTTVYWEATSEAAQRSAVTESRAEESTKQPRRKVEVSAMALGAAAPSSDAEMTATAAKRFFVSRFIMSPVVGVAMGSETRCGDQPPAEPVCRSSKKSRRGSR
jgi:hypothetical protein